MSKYQRVKGTSDFVGPSIKKMSYVEAITKQMALNYGFNEIRTPIFEYTDLFIRSVGDESDIVSKEMYTFLDKGKRSLTLRPEGTAVVARSFIENKLYANNLPVVKLFYTGPMFRYERPQAGRFREFNQFGVEVFGKDSPLIDSDVIISGYNIFIKLGIKNIKLKLNSIGDFASRKKYTEILKEYFGKNIDNLCSDCKRRLNKNPMRILDCKVDSDNPVLLNAPKINEYLSIESQEYFQEVLNVLDLFKIPYEVDSNLVRGLDYYTDTVFEFIIDSDDELNGLAICAGGKYADLIKSLNGMEIPGIGYAFGIERIVAVMDQQGLWDDINDDVDIIVMGLDYESKLQSLELANQLRNAGYRCDLDYVNTSMKPQFKLADKLNARYIIIIGEEERINNTVSIKDTNTKTQETIKRENILTYLEGKKYENA